MNSVKSPLCFDVTNWHEKRFYQTKGSRDKCIVQNPENKEQYFFKTSLNQGVRNYKYEFWSEIIASYVGRSLGFNTLIYDIARKGDKIGCLSKKMNDNGSSLIEGLSILTGYDNTYSEDKSSYNRYTLDFIYEVLKYFDVNIGEFNRMIIFDFIIGNGDRHQENWGFISETRTDLIHKSYVRVRNTHQVKRLLKRIVPFKIRSKISRKIINSQYNKFAPIYDSGSSLARELTDEKVNETLNNEMMFKGFINRSKCEIRKNSGVKYKQSEILNEIMKKDPFTYNSVKTYLIKEVDIEEVKKVIFEINEKMPSDLSAYCLPDNRKELIFELIKERINIIIR